MQTMSIKDLVAPCGRRTKIAGVVRHFWSSSLLNDGQACHAKPRQVLLIEVEGSRRRREIVVIGYRG